MEKKSKRIEKLAAEKSAFEGFTALITGASRGIGRALALELGKRGAKVACAARATSQNRFKLPGTIDETVEEITAGGGEALAVQADLSAADDISKMVDTAASHFGGIDILVNNAAVAFPGDMDIKPKHYDLIMDINVKAPLLTALHAHPHLKKSENARILNVSSITGTHYIPSMMVYGMSKAALDHLSVSMAAQFQADSIAVNCFRIDTQVATEGYMMNAPDEDFSSWLQPGEAALCMSWMLEQGAEYTGRTEEMMELGPRAGIFKAGARDNLSRDWQINKPGG